MAKLFFYYSTMNAGKSTSLLQAAHNYAERGMKTILFTARLDDRASRAQALDLVRSLLLGLVGLFRRRRWERLNRRAGCRARTWDCWWASSPPWPAICLRSWHCSPRRRVDPHYVGTGAARGDAAPRCSTSRACGGTPRRLLHPAADATSRRLRWRRHRANARNWCARHSQ